jgi:hypothetical protein
MASLSFLLQHPGTDLLRAQAKRAALPATRRQRAWVP